MIQIIETTLTCPIAGCTVTAQVAPTDPRDGNPGWDVVDAFGCPHAEDLLSDQGFLDAVCQAAEDEIERARQEAIGGG